MGRCGVGEGSRLGRVRKKKKRYREDNALNVIIELHKLSFSNTDNNKYGKLTTKRYAM